MFVVCLRKSWWLEAQKVCCLGKDGFGRCLMPLIWKEEDQWGPSNEEFLRDQSRKTGEIQSFFTFSWCEGWAWFFGNIWLKFAAHEAIQQSGYTSESNEKWIWWMLVASYYCVPANSVNYDDLAEPPTKSCLFVVEYSQERLPAKSVSPRSCNCNRWKHHGGVKMQVKRCFTGKADGTSWIPRRLVCLHWDFVEIFVQG